jgi:hypothetical protein
MFLTRSLYFTRPSSRMLRDCTYVVQVKCIQTLCEGRKCDWWQTPYLVHGNSEARKDQKNYLLTISLCITRINAMIHDHALIILYEKYGQQLHIIFLIFSGSAAQRGLWPPSRVFLITHNDAPHSVGLLWTSDPLVAETSLLDNTKHTQNRQTSMPPVGFEPTIAAGERP